MPTFSGYTTTVTVDALIGSVSSSIYYLYSIKVTSTYSSSIRKMDSSDSLVWMNSYSLSPIIKGFAIDSNEQSVYFVSSGSPFIVVINSASTGSFQSAQAFSSIYSISNDLKILPLNDNSGYYIIPTKSSTNAPSI